MGSLLFVHRLNQVINNKAFGLGLHDQFYVDTSVAEDVYAHTGFYIFEFVLQCVLCYTVGSRFFLLDKLQCDRLNETDFVRQFRRLGRFDVPLNVTLLVTTAFHGYFYLLLPQAAATGYLTYLRMNRDAEVDITSVHHPRDQQRLSLRLILLLLLYVVMIISVLFGLLFIGIHAVGREPRILQVFEQTLRRYFGSFL